MKVLEAPRTKLVIRSEWCKGCGICVAFCPKGVLAINEQGKVEVVAAERCSGCRNCEVFCPDFAISVERNTADAKS